MTTLTLTIENTKKLNLIKKLLQELKIKFEISTNDIGCSMSEKEFIKKIEKGRSGKKIAVCNSKSEIDYFIDNI